MSDSVRSHPWDSLGKNTRVGWHFLLQCIKVKSESEVTQPCVTLGDPMNCSLWEPSVHGIFQARVLEWDAIAFSEEVSKDYLDLQFNHLYYTANSSPHTLLAAFQCLPHLFTWILPGLTRPQLNSSWKGREQSLGKCRSARSFILLGAEYIPYFSKHYYPPCLSSQRSGSDSFDS